MARTQPHGLTIRLIHTSSIRPEEVESAMRGMQRFKRFGLGLESVMVDGKDRGYFKDMKRGRELFDIVASDNPALGQMVLHCESLFSVFKDLHVYGIGLTPFPMVRLVGDGEFPVKEPALGISKTGCAAMLSVSRIRELEPELVADAIETGTVHELGHLFGKTGHCSNAGCIMEANRNFLDFVERFARQRRDFCYACSGGISAYINSSTRTF